MGKNTWTRGEGLKLCITLMKCTNIQYTDYFCIYGLYTCSSPPLPLLIFIDSIRDLLVCKYDLF